MPANLKPILATVSIAGLLLFFACEQEDLTFKGPFHVRFTDTVAAVRESAPGVVNIRVHNAGPKIGETITIKYTLSGTAREGIDYAVVGGKGTVTIPANQSSGNIQLRLINNANDRLGSQTVILTLNEVTPASLQVGFGKTNNIGRRMTFTINDDCILGGTYTGTRRVNNTTLTIPNVQATSSDCREFTLSNWNIGFFNFEGEKPTLRFIDKKDNSIEVPPQSSPSLGTQDTLKGTGSWNPLNGNLSLNLQIKTKTRDGKRDTLFSLSPLVFIPQK